MTDQGMQNLIDETFGTLESYAESFYFYFEEDTDIDLSHNEELKPLIAQAHEKGIPTILLVEIVKEGM